MLSKTDGNSPTLCISRGRVYAHMRTHVQTNRKKHAHIKKLQLCTRKKQIEEPFSTRRNNRNTVKLIRNQGHFFKERKEKPEKIRSSPPEKIPDFSGLFPETASFISSEGQNFPGTVIFCQQENKNFPETASFMTAEGQKFSENRHFLPTGGQEFPENGQFYDSRKTKK